MDEQEKTPEALATFLVEWFRGPDPTQEEVFEAIFQFIDTLARMPTKLQQRIMCFFAGALQGYRMAVEYHGTEDEHNRTAVQFSKQFAEAVNSERFVTVWLMS